LPEASSVRLDFEGEGAIGAALALSAVPRLHGEASPIWDERGSELADAGGLEPVQLREDGEYRYELLGISESARLEPSELFSPDAADGLSGRLRTGSSTGLLTIELHGRGSLVGRVHVEVRSRKLDYLSHYRWMLGDLVEFASAIIQERFAPTQQRVTPMENLDGQTAYERFALLQATIDDPAIQSALSYILSRPHHAWRDEIEYRRPSQGLRAGPNVHAQLVRVGPRTPWPGSPVPALDTLPVTLHAERPDETLDTIPNRFIKFVLVHWLGLATGLRMALNTLPDVGARRRGLRESQAVINRLSAVLEEPLFTQIGSLTAFPVNNQVLQKREGYRDILRAYSQVEGATQLAWSGGTDVFGIGQRDVATLYEFWAFIELVRIIRSVCDQLDEKPLVRAARDSMNVGLTRGRASVVQGRAVRLGRKILVRLYFNRQFIGPSQASWTMSMRPDCSLQLLSGDFRTRGFESVWLHFDAKYRADDVFEALGVPEANLSPESDDAVSPEATARREDLLKMHAYRDAIRRSVGSYILYPGLPNRKGQVSRFRQYREILPGLGAFCLRPSEAGRPEGESELAHFVDAILQHFASVATTDRRLRYWRHVTTSTLTLEGSAVGWDPLMTKPPADTLVLVGYVRRGCLGWVERQRRYNLRGDHRRGAVELNGPELAAELVVLYGPELPLPQIWTLTGQPEIWNNRRMEETGYVQPRSEVYFCLGLGEQIEGEAVPNSSALDKLRTKKKAGSPFGTPFTATWLELIEAGMRANREAPTMSPEGT
jgi:predicted component of viral defense system (DUF524 family)